MADDNPMATLFDRLADTYDAVGAAADQSAGANPRFGPRHVSPRVEAVGRSR